MDVPDQDYGNNAQPFEGNYPSTVADDANIDPLLNVCTTGEQVLSGMGNSMDDQVLMGGAVWNPALDNPINFYPPVMPGMAPTPLNHSPNPPTETPSSTTTPSSESMFAPTRNSSKSSLPSVKSLDSSTKPRRSSRSTKTQQEPPAEPPSKTPRRRRASKAASIKEEEDEDEDGAELDESDKRNKFLKRNRIAASKCRQKKKEWVSNLEDTRYGLEHENNALHKQYNGLVDELSTIKNQLMQHASCNDANINQWLDNEAKKFVRRIAAQNQPSVQGQPYRDTAGDFCDTHRRGSSVATSIPQSIESEINYDHMSDSLLSSRPGA
ncbi:Transcription factor atf21 [Fusarium austroafricanum]|uniref:Transcription factor atf21 n=1 Tax=Fusarium austroafricanum TaxID=2364996 RepID=A0A8H4P841_9HYPO|nr:Transcription factor atf21 [Fusarium austroafricanum]